jgi:uncharacterized protein (TIGR03067 family)
MHVVVQGERRTVKAGETIYTEAYYRINPAAHPSAIDVIVTKGGMSGQTLLGIYEITGDQMRICLAENGKERPRGFSPQPGSGQTMQLLERQ